MQFSTCSLQTINKPPHQVVPLARQDRETLSADSCDTNCEALSSYGKVSTRCRRHAMSKLRLSISQTLSLTLLLLRIPQTNLKVSSKLSLCEIAGVLLNQRLPLQASRKVLYRALQLSWIQSA